MWQRCPSNCHGPAVDLCSYVIQFIRFQRDKLQDLRIIFCVTEFPTIKFLGAFAKLQKVNVSCVMFVRLNEKLGCHWTNFHEFSYLNIFRESVEISQISLKYVKNNRSCTWGPIYIFWSFLLQFFVEWDMSQRRVVKKITTHIFYSTFFFFSNIVSLMK